MCCKRLRNVRSVLVHARKRRAAKQSCEEFWTGARAREKAKKNGTTKKSKQQHNVTCETNILVLYRKNKEHKRHTHRKEEEQDCFCERDDDGFGFTLFLVVVVVIAVIIIIVLPPVITKNKRIVWI